jgi:hypothetical protein
MYPFFMTIWNILRPFGKFYGTLVNFVVIWYFFPRFGILYREKSGNRGTMAEGWSGRAPPWSAQFSVEYWINLKATQSAEEFVNWNVGLFFSFRPPRCRKCQTQFFSANLNIKGFGGEFIVCQTKTKKTFDLRTTVTPGWVQWVNLHRLKISFVPYTMPQFER